MMPPKKSKAARGEEKDSSHANESDAEGETATDPVEQSPKKVPVKKKKVPFVVTEDILPEKRKRLMPAAEQHLHEWLTEHIEKREEARVSYQDIYQPYLEYCVARAMFGVDNLAFARTVREMFGKNFGVKAESPYKDAVREKKFRKKVKVKVQADSLKLKMRDIIERAIKDAGNPKGGVRFHTLKQYIAARYPALRIDLRPDILKKALERGIKYGHYYCVRGIGACGFYRMWPTEEELEEERKEEERLEQEAKKKKEEGKESSDKENKEEGGGGGEENGEPKEKGEEEPEEEGKEEAKPARRTRGKKEGEKTSAKGKGKGQQGKKKKKSAPTKTYRTRIVHSDPQRIEDCFQLAATYMAEPKEAGYMKIKKYIETYYPNTNVEAHLKRALENGVEKGYWEQVSGSHTTSGRYRMQIEEHDPTADDDLVGMILNAIMACTEPKGCSTMLLKRYVMDYHPDFKVDQRQKLFKRAIERSLKKKILRQISGIGLTGSFELCKPFMPSPAILAGNDTESDYEEESADDDSDMEGYESEDGVVYYDNYVPRPTKRHGHGRQAAIAGKVVQVPSVQRRSTANSSGKRQVGSQKQKRTARKTSPKKTYKEAETSEEESEEEAPKKRKRKAPPKKVTKGKQTGKKATPRKTTQEADESEEDEERVAKSPERARAVARKRVYKEVDEEDEEDEDEPLRKSRSRPASASKRSYKEVDEEDEDEDEEPLEKKSPSRTPANKGKQKKSSKKQH